jgi:hypothetical protein
MQRVVGGTKISEAGHLVHQDFIVFESFDTFRRRNPSIVAIDISAVEYRQNDEERDETWLCTVRTGDFGVGVIKSEQVPADVVAVDPPELLQEARTHYR